MIGSQGSVWLVLSKPTMFFQFPFAFHGHDISLNNLVTLYQRPPISTTVIKHCFKLSSKKHYSQEYRYIQYQPDRPGPRPAPYSIWLMDWWWPRRSSVFWWPPTVPSPVLIFAWNINERRLVSIGCQKFCWYEEVVVCSKRMAQEVLVKGIEYKPIISGNCTTLGYLGN